MRTGSVAGGDAAGDTLAGIRWLIGSSQGDVLRGDSAANRLDGGAGDDTLAGGLGADTLAGGAGAHDLADYGSETADIAIDLSTQSGTGGSAQGDSLTGVEEVQGGSGDDTLTGDGFDNRLAGGSGDDVLRGTNGADTMDGGTGIDTADYGFGFWGPGEGVVINLGTGFAATGPAQGDVLLGIENVIGTNQADQITGDAGDNRLEGGAGRDYLSGGSGGRDTAAYVHSSGAVSVDLAIGQGSGGDAEGDTLAGIDDLVGSDGADTLAGNAGANLLVGGAGLDRLLGRGGADTLLGDGYDEASYLGDTVGVAVSLLDGTGTGGDAEGDVLTGIRDLQGGNGNDTLTGDAGFNQLDGFVGDDLLIGGPGADVLLGGAGNDTVSYAGMQAGIDASIAVGGASDGDLYYDNGIEAIIGGAGDDTLTGDHRANMLAGGEGDDILEGGVGNDLLQGEGGDDFIATGGLVDVDTLSGGSGTDTLSLLFSPPGAAVDLAAGTLHFTGGATSSIDGFEVVFATAGGDTLLGDAADEAFSGLDGNDSIDGRGGDDTIAGGFATNTLQGGAGNDLILVDSSTDQVDGGSGQDTVSWADLQFGLFGDYEPVLLGVWWLSGANGRNSVAGAEALILTTHDDSIFDDEGIDLLISGNGGSDRIDAGLGFDVIDYRWTGDAVTLYLDGIATATHGAATDTLLGFEGAIGGGGADTFQGTIFGNLLDGGAGADSITGNGGLDTLRGGAGNDTLAGDALTALSEGGEGADLLTGGGADMRGGSGNDTLIGGIFASNMQGGEGDDWLLPDIGADTVDGGAGFDTVDYSPLAIGMDTSGVTAIAIERVVGSAQGDRLKLVTSLGIHYLGAGGNDTMIGGGGADTLDGGADTDTAAFEQAAAASLATGTATVAGVTDQLIGIEVLLGSAANDTLEGGSAAETLQGAAGNDILLGSPGDDVLDGGADIDTADYGNAAAPVLIQLGVIGQAVQASGTDTLFGIENATGSAGDDTIYGTIGAEVLKGGAGDDSLMPDLGQDTIDGGTGYDRLSYGNLVVAIDTDGVVATGIEAVSGTIYDDRLILPLLADAVIDGGGGNDTLGGTRGASIFVGGIGTDMVTYEASEVRIVLDLAAGTGVHALIGPDGKALLVDGVLQFGTDQFVEVEIFAGSNEDDSMQGGDGDEELRGTGGLDNIRGGGGNDSILGGTHGVPISLAGSLLDGEGGNDTVIGGGPGDSLYGGAGNDLVRVGATALVDWTAAVIQGGEGNDTLIGGAKADLLDGGAGDDTVFGADGDDTMIASHDHDVFDGGVGMDRIVADAFAGGILVDLVLGFLRVDAGLTITLLGIESVTATAQADTVIGSDAANDILAGAGNDSIEGRGGGDSIQGGAGDDTIDGNAGDDVIEGGAGADRLSGDLALGSAPEMVFDIVSFRGSSAGVDVDLKVNGPADASGGDAQGDSIYGFSGIIGSDFNDTLAGAGMGAIVGGAGDDSIAADSNLAEAFEGGEGFDVLSYDGWATGVLIDLGLTYGDLIEAGLVIPGNPFGTHAAALATIADHLTGRFAVGHYGAAEEDLISNIEKIIGSDGADTLLGGDGTDNLDGEEGNDSIDGRDGADSLAGSAGSDTIHGGDAQDSLSGGQDDDLLAGDGGADRLEGNAGNDTVQGGSGNDTLDGNEGADRLEGGAGADYLGGGPDGQADRLVFAALSDSTVAAHDTSNGFEIGTDKVDFVQLGVAIGGWNATAFVAGAFTAAGQVRFQDGALQVNADANLLTWEMEIRFENLLGGSALTAADILFA